MRATPRLTASTRFCPLTSDTESSSSRVRLDRWLWTARFFKTRGLAKAAVEGGHVQVAGKRAKPAKEIGVGTELAIRKGPDLYSVIVVAIAAQRGPAKVARTLYEEAETSVEAREADRARRRMERAGLKIPAKRPDKRARRDLRELRGQADVAPEDTERP